MRVKPKIEVGTANQKAASCQKKGPRTPNPARSAPPKKVDPLS